MKKTIAILMSMLMVFPIAFAQLEPEVDAGVTPDSPLYGIDVFFDDVRASFATQAEEKARIRLEIAEERAAEMLASVDNEQAFERARIENQKQIQEMQKAFNGSKDEAKMMKLQQQFQRHIMVLQRVRENAPESALKGLDNAIQNCNQIFEKNQLKISTENRQSLTEIKNEISAGEASKSGSNNGGK